MDNELKSMINQLNEAEAKTTEEVTEQETTEEVTDKASVDALRAETPETDEEAQNDETEATEDNDETESESEENSDDAEESEDDEPADPVLEFNGKKYTEEQLTELLNDGLRQSDYTKKTTELAEQRKAFQDEQQTWQAQVNQQVAQERQAYLDAVDELVKVKNLFAPQRKSDIEMTQLATEDPLEYNKHVAMYDALDKAMADVQGIYAQDAEINQQYNDHQLQQYAQGQVAELRKTPDFEKFEDAYPAFIENMVSNGIDQNIALNILDANIITLLNDGLKYRGAKTNVAKKTSEVKDGLKILKTKKKVKTPMKQNKTVDEQIMALPVGTRAEQLAALQALD